MSIEERIQKINSKLEPKTVNISENEIKRLIRKFVFDEKFSLDENDLKYEIIKDAKCDLKTSEDIFKKMLALGFQICHNWRFGYSLRKFANMRGYITEEEFKKLDEKIEERSKKEDEHEAKFIEKYGADKSKWSNDVWDEYEYGEEE